MTPERLVGPANIAQLPLDPVTVREFLPPYIHLRMMPARFPHRSFIPYNLLIKPHTVIWEHSPLLSGVCRKKLLMFLCEAFESMSICCSPPSGRDAPQNLHKLSSLPYIYLQRHPPLP